MSNTGPSIPDTFPNEVIRMFLAQLSYKQLKGLQQVASIWNYLISKTGLLSMAAITVLKEEYSYLMIESEIKALDAIELDTLIVNQEKIYAHLEKKYKLLPGDLKKERLEAFAAEDFSSFLERRQQVFLREMRVATGMIADDATLGSNEKIFILMAQIGNVQKLQEWSAKKELAISRSGYIWSLLKAAENGHLPCVQHLLEKAGAAISNKHKGWALKGAAMNGHLPCVQHLIETCKKVSDQDKQTALKIAEERKDNKIAQYLRSHLNPKPSHVNPLVFSAIDSPNQNDTHKRKQEDDDNENNPSKKLFSKT